MEQSRNHRRFRTGIEMEIRFTGGGGSTKSTTVTTPKPMEGWEQPVKDIGGWVSNQLIPWMGSEYHPALQQQWQRPLEQRVAGFTVPQTMAQEGVVGNVDIAQQGLKDLWSNTAGTTQNLVGQGLQATQAAAPALNQTMQGGYLPTQTAAQSANVMGNVMSGQMGSQGTQPANVLSNMMSGQYMNANTNPYAQSYMDMATRPIQQMFQQDMARNASSAAGAGRDTGGLQQALNLSAADQRGRQMIEATTPFLNQMYQTGMGNMMGAAGMGNQMRQQDIGNMMNAAQMGNQLWQGERNLQMGTASQAPGWALQAGQQQTGAIDPMIALQQQGLRNYGALSGVGETQQGYNQMLMDTANNAVYEPFEAGIGRVLGPLMGLATAQTGSSTSATGPNMAPSPLSQALGAGSNMASIYALLSGLGRA